MNYRCGHYQVDLSTPKVMGIVNVTPDSFSDGGQYASVRQAIEHGVRLVAEGADILDIGGESTRPGAAPVPLDEELRRVIPVIEGLSNLVNVPISIDTYKPEVMRAAVAVGADIINDVFALRQPGALEAAAAGNAGICLMHMLGDPQTMQNDPRYENVVDEVNVFLKQRADAAVEAGIARERIMLDPGFGFGKRSVHNIALLRELPALCDLGYPVLTGLSRKSLLGKITGNRIEDRLPASIAAAVMAAIKGARILRVHDVKATKDALAVVSVLQD